MTPPGWASPRYTGGVSAALFRLWCAWALVLLVGVVSACAPEVAPPRLDRVSPAWGYSGTDTIVRLAGAGLHPKVDAAGRANISVDSAFTVVLDTSPRSVLDGVTRVDSTELVATVPRGLEPGRYGLTVTTPTGEQARLFEAFTVTPTQASALSVDTADVRVDVREDALLEIRVVDPSGDPVPLDVPVEVRASTKSGDASAVVFRDGLEDQRTVSPGVVRGSLDGAGGASLYFTSTAVDEVTVTVQGMGLSDHLKGASPAVRFEPGGVEGVRVELPDSDVTAGVPVDVTLRLVDGAGNTTRGELAYVTVQESCSYSSARFRTAVAVEDTLVLEDVVLTGATVPGGCPDNRIEVYGVVGGETIAGESDDLTVLPAAADGYDLTLSLASVQAGASGQTIGVVARDPYNNPVIDHSASLSLTDDAGGLDPAASVGSASCSAFFEGRAACAVVLERADPAVTVVVDDELGRRGISPGFEVTAGSADQLVVVVDPNEKTADDTFLLQVQPLDRFGNATGLDDLGGADAVELTDRGAALSCVGRYEGPTEGLVTWLCQVTEAGESLRVEASVPGLATAESAAFDVVNGALGGAVVVPSTTVVEAGTPLTVEVQATDTWGNPYLVQAASSVDLTDASGELTARALSLDALGQSTASVTLTLAREDAQLVVSSGGSELGRSADIEVQPAEHTAYDVELPSTWAEVGTDVTVSLRAIDAYGNTTDPLTTGLLVDTDSGLAQGTQVVLVDGRAEAVLEWDEPVLEDTVQVTQDGGLLGGESPPVDVVDLACDRGPTAVLTVDGGAERVLCTVLGTTPLATLSAGASAAGDAALSTWHTSDGDGSSVRRTTPTWTESWVGPGARVPSVVVVDAAGCADVATVTVWAGPADGEPVGPVSVDVADNTLVAGSLSGGVTTVSVGATDCAGDPASGATLYVRADLGALSSGSSTLSDTGRGLALSLDSSGEGDVEWSVVSDDVAAVATVHAGVLTGAAYGLGQASVDGDARRPRVVGLSPVGALVEPTSSLTVDFSEPMLPSTVTDTAFSLVDPSGGTVAVAASLGAADDQVTLSLDPLLDPAAGAYWLTISSDLRDAGGGNRLDGEETGLASDLVVSIGDVPSATADVTACVPSGAVITPDLDPGTGDQADAVELDVVATEVPELWWLEVTLADGTPIDWRATAASGATDTLSWDGRGVDGLVVPAGDYVLEVAALDEDRQAAATCVASVTVVHALSSPEAP